MMVTVAIIAAVILWSNCIKTKMSKSINRYDFAIQMKCYRILVLDCKCDIVI